MTFNTNMFDWVENIYKHSVDNQEWTPIITILIIGVMLKYGSHILTTFLVHKREMTKIENEKELNLKDIENETPAKNDGNTD